MSPYIDELRAKWYYYPLVGIVFFVVVILKIVMWIPGINYLISHILTGGKEGLNR